MPQQKFLYKCQCIEIAGHCHSNKVPINGCKVIHSPTACQGDLREDETNRAKDSMNVAGFVAVDLNIPKKSIFLNAIQWICIKLFTN